MAHPRYSWCARTSRCRRAHPDLSDDRGLGQATLRKLVLDALDDTQLDDTLPAKMRERYRLADVGESIHLLHSPPPDVDVAALVQRSHPAWQRVKFDELLAQQLSMRMSYRARRMRQRAAAARRRSVACAVQEELPFALTRAQARARQISSPISPSRTRCSDCLQGDVGSGKTIVAALGCCRRRRRGRQAAVMAPTEILSEQHWRKFSEWLAPLG
jgi:ATP-dependent DNA helicase RecG